MVGKPRMFGANRRKSKRVDHRESASNRGYDTQWRNLRDQYILDYPLCQHCEANGYTTAAREVDHIVPFDGLKDPNRLYWDNLQSLCRRCHAVKTRQEQRGRGG